MKRADMVLKNADKMNCKKFVTAKVPFYLSVKASLPC